MPRKTYRKVITTPELLTQINPKNIKMAERFIKDKNKGCSDTTVVNYESDLNIFFTWNLLYNENKFFVDIKKIEFSDFFSYAIEDLQWGSSRFGRMKSCLSSFSNFIVNYFDEDYPNFKNVILKSIENLPKNPVRDKTILSETQVDSLLDYLLNTLNRPQEACLLSLAVTCGARAAELVRFTTSIIDEDNVAFDGLFIETLKEIKTKGRGKGGKKLHKYILKDDFLPYYHAWLPIREKIMKENNQDHDFLFIRQDGYPAKTDTIRGWSEKWEKFLEVPFYFHSLRHYIVTHFTRLGLDTDFIVELMGWSTSDMVKIYNDLTAKERKWKNLDKLKTSKEPNEDGGVLK